MWFRVAVEWKYALCGFRRHSTGGNAMKEGAPQQPLWVRSSLIRVEAYKRSGTDMSMARDFHYPFTLSPLLVVRLRRRVKTLGSALPKNHDVTIPNLFSCTAPWLSILTGNSANADLSLPSAETNG